MQTLSTPTFRQFDSILITPGYAASLVRKAKLSADQHSAKASNEDGSLSDVPVMRKDEFGPIYFVPIDLGNRLRFLVEGFPQPIWVQPALPFERTRSNNLYYEVCDAIAYWLWQLRDEVKHHLAGLGTAPLTFFFEFSPLESFENLERNFARVEDLASYFRVSANGAGICIAVPEQLLPYLYAADNAGERVLVEQLMHGFNLLLTQASLPVIADQDIRRITDTCAPPGLKKKFFIIDTADNILTDPSRLVRVRYVQDYEVSRILDSLGPSLGTDCPPIGVIRKKEDKQKLLKNIVMKVLFPRLKQAIARYNSQQLLERLIALNESLIHEKERQRILTPTRIACFVSEERHTLDLRKTLNKIERTSIAVRCLIEHAAAEQATGSDVLSLTAVDELVALMDQIVTWASLGDQIRYDLIDIEISILPTGRIGTDKSIGDEVFSPYLLSKTKEDVANATKAYEYVFAQRKVRETTDVPAHLDRAFVADYGVSFTRICEFINRVGVIGYHQTKPYGMLPQYELFAALNQLPNGFDENEFSNALAFLTLYRRGNVDTIPPGYESFDISPWRYNRRLSLLRKPLVAYETSDPNNPLIYWGFRQLLVSRSNMAEQIRYGRFKTRDKSQVVQSIGKIVGERGERLTQKVYERLSLPLALIDKEVTIAPKGKLRNVQDLGDVDVLSILEKEKTVYSLECKSLAPSRNMKEMIEEIEKLFGADDLLGKHQRRHDWLVSNLGLLGRKYGLDLTGYTVKSFFVTEEAMLTPFLKKTELPMPIVTIYEIDANGYQALTQT